MDRVNGVLTMFSYDEKFSTFHRTFMFLNNKDNKRTRPRVLRIGNEFFWFPYIRKVKYSSFSSMQCYIEDIVYYSDFD